MVQRVAESFIDTAVKLVEDTGSALAAALASNNVDKCLSKKDDSSFSSTPASEMTRAIVASTVKEVSWRSIRSTVVGDSLEVLDCLPDAPESNRIRVTGYLRGAPLYVHSLMHIMGVGTSRLESVEVGHDPLTSASRELKSHGARNISDDASYTCVADPSKQDSLEMESTPDTLMGEQTWPTEEELLHMTSAGDGSAGRDQRNLNVSLPHGMSSYQADWYVDEKGNFEPEYKDDDKDEGNVDGDDDEMQGSDDDDGDDDMTLDGSVLDLGMNFTGSGNSQVKKSKIREAQEDDEFPDEMDTPEDVAARVRFARYRSLQSFRTSPWHPKENLPADYGRIYQFQNFNIAQKASLNYLKSIRNLQDTQKLESKSINSANKASRSRASSLTTGGSVIDDESVEMGGMIESASGDVPGSTSHTPAGAQEFIPSGQYVSITMSDVPPAVVEAYRVQGFLALFSLLPHENKLSVLHCAVERREGYDDPIKCKENLTFQVGFRSFTARPIFSEINLNCDKHKMHRFFKKGELCMASVYGPVTFIPCPVLVFKENELTGITTLVATGSLSSIDPDRIMLKKVVLSGLPIRVRKRNAVVRQLFYDPQVTFF